MVEEADGGHGRRQSEQAVELVAPLFGRHGAAHPGWLDGPADLALDALDELLDGGGRGGGLLALEAAQRHLVLPVGEIQLDEAAGNQRSAHQEDKDDDVFAKQAAMTPARGSRDAAGRGRPAQRGCDHLKISGTTWSAWPRTDWGIASPSVWAVCRL